jgi:hypothetical protein
VRYAEARRRRQSPRAKAGEFMYLRKQNASIADRLKSVFRVDD